MDDKVKMNVGQLIERLKEFPPETIVTLKVGIYNRRSGEDAYIHDWSFDFCKYIDNGSYKEIRLPAKFCRDSDFEYVSTTLRKK